MKTLVLFIFFMAATFLFYGQINLSAAAKDSLLKANAERYLTNKLGAGFKKKHLTFLFIKESGQAVAVYQTKGKPRSDGKNTLFVHFKYMNTDIDSARIVATKEDILAGIKGKPCTLFIGLDKAKELAEKKGLPKGDRPWKISLSELGSHQTPKWGFTETDYDHNGHGKGAYMNIDMIDGTVDAGMWSSIP